MNLDEGCTACGRRWDDPEMHEGQCSRCKRCLECCGHATVPHTCAWKWERKDHNQQRRSREAYERWEGNYKILGGRGNRRIV